jgi:hypothetical protein
MTPTHWSRRDVLKTVSGAAAAGLVAAHARPAAAQAV